MNELIQVCIQVAAGSGERKIYDEKTLKLLETHQTSLKYPYAYGFILDTDAPDGCNLDCYLITAEKLASGAVVTCQPVGLMVQYENSEADYKIIAALPNEDVCFDEAVYQKLTAFITAAFAENPEITIGFGPMQSRQAAIELVQVSMVNPK